MTYLWCGDIERRLMVAKDDVLSIKLTKFRKKREYVANSIECMLRIYYTVIKRDVIVDIVRLCLDYKTQKPRERLKELC